MTGETKKRKTTRKSTPKKNKLEILKELGLLGAIKDSQVTSKNYKKYIREEFEKKR